MFKCLKLVLPLLFLPSIGNAGELLISEPYIQANVPGADNTVGYLIAENPSDQDLRLVGVESDVAAVTELHTHSIENDRMQMRQVEYIEIKANSQVTLAPNGYHLMFIQLNQRLKPGESVAVTFSYDDGSVQEVELPIVDTRKKNAERHAHH